MSDGHGLNAGRCGGDLRPAPEGARAGSGNCYASASVRKSVALVPISLGLTGSSPAVAAGLVAAAATFMESATGAIIIFQGSMRTSAQNTKACIGQNAGCMYSSSFHCNARQAKVFHFQQLIVPDFYADIAVRGAGAAFSADLAFDCVADLIDVRPAPFKPISATRTFNTPSGTPSYRRQGSRISGTSEVLADLGHYKQVATCDGLKRTSSARCDAGREEHIRWRMKGLP